MRIGALLANFVAIAAMANAGTLRKIWDFAAGAPGIYRLGFSPDGRHIAAVVGLAWDKQSVLVLDAADPQARMRRLEVNPKNFGDISWSPSGRQLMIANTRLRLADGEVCSLPDGTGLPSFVGENRLIGQEVRPIPSSRPRTPPTGQPFLKFFDSDCKEGEEWNLPDEQGLFDTSAERGLIFVRQGTRASVIDATSRTVLRDLSSLGLRVDTGFRPVRFADSGKAICGAVGPEWQVSVTCLDVDTAVELATTKEFTYLGINSSLHSRRVVLSDYRRRFDFIEFGWGLGSLKRRIVWDFGTNKELLSWSPKPQTLVTLERPSGWSQPYPFDISPDGEFIVEGGAGSISLYRIEP